MSVTSVKNETVYNSGVAIWDPSELATLSVFYDGIVLPAASHKTSGRSLVLQRVAGSEHLFKLLSIKIGQITFVDRQSRKPTTFGRLTDEWDARCDPLYKENVLRRLDPPAEDRLEDALTLAALEPNDQRTVQQLSDRILDSPTTIPTRWEPFWSVQIRVKDLEQGGSALGAHMDELNLEIVDTRDENQADRPEIAINMNIQKLAGRAVGLDVRRMQLKTKSSSTPDEGSTIFIQEDYLRHLMRSDTLMPGLFLAKADIARTTLAESLMAGAIFSFVVPKLAALVPDQILEVRAKTASTREAFSLHVQALASDVEEALRDGDDIAKVRAHACTAS